VALWIGGCGAASPGLGGDCASCDGAGVRAQLDGRGDPIADYFRSSDINNDGIVQSDYAAILSGIARRTGCADSTARTFVVSDDVLSPGSPFPRIISTLCTDDDTRAPNLFLSAPFRLGSSDDVDPRNLELFAWDDPAQTYRFYATSPVGDKQLKLEVEPSRCAGCHMTPADLDATKMAMTPIMNELTAPWPHWNAAPGFSSSDFVVPSGTPSASNYAQLATSRLASAQRFEEIVRAGHSKVARARALLRRAAADLDSVLSLLRPMFCEEQINYVTENGGLVDVAAVIDPSIARMYRAANQVGPWTWLNPPASLQLGALDDPNARLFMMPVRGNAGIELENRLVAFGLLTPVQVLRLHALDWQAPVFSDLRCGLWKNGRDRLKASPPALSGNNGQALSTVFELLMTSSDVPLRGPDGALIALKSADRLSALVDALRAGSLTGADCANDGYCVVDLGAFGALLDGQVKSYDGQPDARARLTDERKRRVCHVVQPVGGSPRFANAPSLPATDQCN
jgi:hypothetical protein